MTTPEQMQQQPGSPPQPPYKWIALAVLLVTVSGGLYQLTKKDKGATDGTVGDTTASAPGSLSGQTAGGAIAVAPATGTTGATQQPSSTLTSKHATGAGSASAPGVPAIGTGVGLPSAPSVAMAPGVPATGSVPAAGGAPAASAPMPPQDQCVTVTYKHKVMSTHADEETCSHHKNHLKLVKPNDFAIDGKSVCVRVNGTPVHYLGVKGHSDEVIFGSVAGPKSVVTVRYCAGKGCAAVAKEDCTVPKDEFMEAIGGSEGASQNPKLGQWDPDSKDVDVMAKLDGDVKRELETNADLNGRAPSGAMFKDWIAEVQTGACGTAQAKN